MRELDRWATARDDGYPRCTDDLVNTEFADILSGIAESHHLNQLVDVAFAGTEEAAAERPPIDSIPTTQDLAPNIDDEELIDNEEELLEKIPLPGNPTTETQRRKRWLELPRRARIAIRRLHRNFKHLPKQALVQMLRAAKAPTIYIEAAKAHRCAPCEQTKPKPPTHKVAPPKP